MAVPRLYVGNLLYTVQQAENEELFKDNNIPTKNIDMSTDSFTGRNPSYCFVDFESVEDATDAMQRLQGQLVRDRPVKLGYNTERQHRTHHRPTIISDQGRREAKVSTFKPNDKTYAYDRWSGQDAPERWTAASDEHRRLYVGGLPRKPYQSAVNAEMHALFRGRQLEAVSKIISPQISKKSEPGSHYYCFVDLATAQEAKAAVEELDVKKTMYGGRYRISVATMGPTTKVVRDQLGGGVACNEASEPRVRKLHENWRRLDVD